MKTKKILLGLLVLVLIGALAVILYLFISKPRLDIGKIPEGWKVVEVIKRPDGTISGYLKGKGTVNDSLTLFKEGMVKSGWEIIKEGELEVFFSKKDRSAVLLVFPVEGEEVEAFIVISTNPLLDTSKPKVPTEDVEGKDLEEVPRMAGTVRISYESKPEADYVEYIIKSPVKEVFDYYFTGLEKNGWNIDNSGFSENTAGMNANKVGKGILIINITKDDIFGEYTIIQLNLIK